MPLSVSIARVDILHMASPDLPACYKGTLFSGGSTSPKNIEELTQQAAEHAVGTMYFPLGGDFVLPTGDEPFLYKASMIHQQSQKIFAVFEQKKFVECPDELYQKVESILSHFPGGYQNE